MEQVSPETENQLKIYSEIINSTEELHPDLIPYLSKSKELGWDILQHPLVYSVPFIASGLINRQYEYKKTSVAKALLENNFDSYVFLHERPYRIGAFINIQHRMKDTVYWRLLGDVWTDTENQHSYLKELKVLVTSLRPNRHYLMNEEEDNYFRSLPDEVIIYRGCIKNLNENGLSWTLNKDKADWFSNRLNREGKAIILEKKINKRELIAFFNGRNEYEVIHIPTKKKGNKNVL